MQINFSSLPHIRAHRHRAGLLSLSPLSMHMEEKGDWCRASVESDE